ncbi:hypothetical protein UNH65_19705 [Chitinophaga sp. 180180018-2]|nr:hypothetical protein [Chitinophaga sp. 212800010-3]
MAKRNPKGITRMKKASELVSFEAFFGFDIVF